MRGTCPFHDDQLNSLLVNTEKDLFKCFGCCKDGGPVNFFSTINRITDQKAAVLLSYWLQGQRSA